MGSPHHRYFGLAHDRECFERGQASLALVKVATIRLGTRTAAARVEESDGEVVEVSAADVGSLLALPDWPQIAAGAAGPRHSLSEVNYAPLVPRPSKIVCVGQNYRGHLAEQGIEAPKCPTLFAKFYLRSGRGA